MKAEDERTCREFARQEALPLRRLAYLLCSD
ncbi:hypothetical protein JOF53_004648 [Crossiella equi]|uniref:Uncharacterized protein n=1 Tax=Crossiella equi TaxID=130796 RepID=A0ABS5AHE1_9PSEU|nr:hypothetical protein [Crossiella equi]